MEAYSSDDERLDFSPFSPQTSNYNLPPESAPHFVTETDLPLGFLPETFLTDTEVGDIKWPWIPQREGQPSGSFSDQATGGLDPSSSRPVADSDDRMSSPQQEPPPRPLVLETLFSRSNRRLQRKWDLPMILKGIEICACPDSGAENNIILEETAIALGLKEEIDDSSSELFTIANGKQIKSTGRISVDCAFARDPSVIKTCVFHVFTRLVVPLIMGAGFLRETDTLSLYRNRLQERPWIANLPLRVMHIDGAKERFKCYINDKEVLANADTGSEMDLMSRNYALESQYKIKKLESDTEIQFADGSIAVLAGQIFSRFKTCERDPWSTKWFYVLENLTCDVLLGEETLDENDAFNLDTSTVTTQQDSPGLDLNTIFWAKSVERRLADLLNLGNKATAQKRGNSADIVGSSRVYFSSPALNGLDPRFAGWLRDMRLASAHQGGQTPEAPTFITEDQMLEFDAYELDRRERIDTEMENMPASLRTAAQNEETEIRKGYDRSRDLVLAALNDSAVSPGRHTQGREMGSQGEIHLSPISRSPTVPPLLAGGQTPTPARPDTEQWLPALAEALRQSNSRETISNPRGFRCSHPGCISPPFQTQHSLNQHWDAHLEQAAPYWEYSCTEKGCPRGLAGKGFKSKDEAVRHKQTQHRSYIILPKPAGGRIPKT